MKWSSLTPYRHEQQKQPQQVAFAQMRVRAHNNNNQIRSCQFETRVKGRDLGEGIGEGMEGKRERRK